MRLACIYGQSIVHPSLQHALCALIGSHMRLQIQKDEYLGRAINMMRHRLNDPVLLDEDDLFTAFLLVQVGAFNRNIREFKAHAGGFIVLMKYLHDRAGGNLKSYPLAQLWPAARYALLDSVIPTYDLAADMEYSVSIFDLCDQLQTICDPRFRDPHCGFWDISTAFSRGYWLGRCLVLFTQNPQSESFKSYIYTSINYLASQLAIGEFWFLSSNIEGEFKHPFSRPDRDAACLIADCLGKSLFFLLLAIVKSPTLEAARASPLVIRAAKAFFRFIHAVKIAIPRPPSKGFLYDDSLIPAPVRQLCRTHWIGGLINSLRMLQNHLN